MTEYIQATVTGLFPKDDVDMIYSHYYGTPDEALTLDEKVNAIIALINLDITNKLKAPSEKLIELAKKAEVEALTQRVESSLQASYQTVEL